MFSLKGFQLGHTLAWIGYRGGGGGVIPLAVACCTPDRLAPFFSVPGVSITALYNMATDSWSNGPDIPMTISVPSLANLRGGGEMILFNGDHLQDADERSMHNVALFQGLGRTRRSTTRCISWTKPQGRGLEHPMTSVEQVRSSLHEFGQK